MKKDKILKLVVDIQVGASMAKDWLNRNDIDKDEYIWKELEEVLSASEKLMHECFK